MRAEVARLAGTATHEALGRGGGQHHQRHPDAGEQRPDRIDRDRYAQQDNETDEIPSSARDDRAPDVHDRVHVALDPLDQEAGRVRLVKGAVLPHHPVEQVDAHVRGGALRDAGQQHLLRHPRDGAQHEDTHQHQSDPEQRVFLPGNEDLVEHRLHQPGERSQRTAFDDHEEDREGHQARVLLEVVAPEPAQKVPRRVGLIVHAGAVVRWALIGQV